MLARRSPRRRSLAPNRQYARAKELVRDDFISQADVDAAEVQVDQRKADVKQAKAQLEASQADLDHTTIRSPIDGVVIARSIDVGQTVAASLQAPKLFVIANDLRQMQVETKIDEADIGRIRPGLKVTFSVDAFPDETFEGKVSQVRLEPITEQNVVTYTTVIATRNDNLSLRPGMTANVTVLVDSREDVLKVPNAALRFRPASMNGGGRGGPGGGMPGGGSGGGAPGSMRRGFAALFSHLVPAAYAQDGAPGGGGNWPGANDPLVQKIREQMRSGEITREEGREMIRKYMESKGMSMPTRGGASEAGGANAKPASAKPANAKPAAGRGARAEAGGSAAMGGGRAPKLKPGTVWILENGKPKSIKVMTGITDGSMTEVQSDELKSGTMIIVGTEIAAAKSSGLTPPPGMGGPQFRGPGGGGGGTGGRR